MKDSAKPFSSDSGDTPVNGQTSEGITKRPYRKPELVCYGRVEDMTRAATRSGSEAGGKPRR